MATSFINAHLITGDGRDFAGGSVKIDKGRIVEVRTEGEPSGADKVIDLGGRALLPGFIDLHNHVVGGDCARGYGDEAKSFRMDEPIVNAVMETVRASRTVLRSGITSARDTAARDYIDVDLKRAQAQGMVEGPRMLAAGPGVWMTGGHGSFLEPGHEADGVDAIVRRVREMVAREGRRD